MKAISILGSTGSIGRSCLKVIDSCREEFRVVGLAAGDNLELLVEQVASFQPEVVSVANPASIGSVVDRLSHQKVDAVPRVVAGADGLIEVATHPEAQLVVSAIVGVTGLQPTYEAICHNKTVALANKEVLVIAGDLIMGAARSSHVGILPVDSEHSAIHQCLRSGRHEEVRRIILTASGGPFRTLPIEQLEEVTPQMALNHPTWNMGNRVTIDSATLMNKGFEVLEAKWLFGFPVEKISVMIHPQSIVHSMVEFVDGSLIAQLGVTDMRFPIQYALTYPERCKSLLPNLDLCKLRRLEFMEPDLEKFPSLALAMRAARETGNQPCVLNAADEIAVDAFLRGKIRFTAVTEIVEKMMDFLSEDQPLGTVEEILEFDRIIRKETLQLIERDYSQQGEN